MSLADELLQDLEDGPDEFVDENEDAEEGKCVVMDIEEGMEDDCGSISSIKKVAKLRDSARLKSIMEKIAIFQGKERKSREVSGPVEADPEYQLIVEANSVTVEIENETNVIHKFVRDWYSVRFPELESFISVPLEYIKTVKELANNIERTKQSDVLQDFLSPATIMIVSVSASTTQGSELSEQQLGRILEACQMVLDLADIRDRIQAYVESRMTFIAPNLAIILGASTAAKLMGLAGGLTTLSKIPACNLLLLGARKRTLTGFTSTAIQPHAGVIFHSQMVQSLPSDLQRRAARLISAKCSLAGRVDSFHESLDGHVGDDLLADIQSKLEKWQEPPPVKSIKPLPMPLDKPSRKRGGRRARKMKERLGMTELRKEANRMTFAEIDDDAYQEDLGMNLGRLGKSKSGRIRGPTVDAKTRARISKTLQQKLQKQGSQSVWGGSTTVRRQVAGTSSSIAFTPLQGLEIVNPQAAESKVLEANATYFSATSGFRCAARSNKNA